MLFHRPSCTLLSLRRLQPTSLEFVSRVTAFLICVMTAEHEAITLGRWRTPSPRSPRSRATRIPFSSSSAGSSTQEWRSWLELAVRVDDLPLDVTTEYVWRWFSSEGVIVRIEVFDSKNGRGTMSARVRFQPPPARAFWRNGKILVDHPDKRNFPDGAILAVAVSDESRRRALQTPTGGGDYPNKIILPLCGLAFGVMLSPSGMAVLKGIEQQSNLTLEFDVNLKRLAVFFSFTVETASGSEPRQYKFAMEPHRVKSLVQISESGSERSTCHLVIRVARPPEYFWRTDDILESFQERAQVWHINSTWKRTTEIVRRGSVTAKRPIALYNEVPDPDDIDIGRWTTFRVSIDDESDKNQNTLQHLQSALQDVNIQTEHSTDFAFSYDRSVMWNHLDHPPSAKSGQPSALLGLPPVIHLPFEVRYQLEVCVSQGLISEHAISCEFLQRLAELPASDATRRLEYLVDQASKLYSPMELFDNEDAESFAPSFRIPHYCTLVRKVSITPTTIHFNSPSVESSNRVVRWYSQLQDRFLRIQFVEEYEVGRMGLNRHRNEELWERINRTLFHGIRIGDRVYEFLAFGSSQLRQSGAYFFCPTAQTSCNDIRDWMGQFGHIKIVAKYAARLGQCFSTTREIRGIHSPAIKHIPDIKRNGYCFTDGVGIISQFLAQMVTEEMTLDVFDEPTAFQFRMGGCKGVLAVWPEAKKMDVLVRNSQEKFVADIKGLEIIRCAGYATATLNRQTITILECLGVPRRVFANLLEQQITAYEKAYTDNGTAVELLTKFVDENQSTVVLAELLKAEFKSADCNEPFVVNLLNLWISWSLKLLKEKARIHVPKSAFVLGCADETGTLRGHSKVTEGSVEKEMHKLPQIFLQLSNPKHYEETHIVSGICIVGRNPSLHPGDIRVVQAVDNPQLRHLKDVVVFPTKGDRPVPNMLSGGDLDGDDFFVIWDKDLIPRQWNHPPMNYDPPEPKELGRDVVVDDLREFFVNYMKNDVLPLIATSHLAFADEYGPKSQLCKPLSALPHHC